ncbi:hypothetical protein GcC1_076038 [Golovinomyces cichoracearum]|uniref:Uncharacterized protein n=1 Tax=Golovinomyces cichoracearum TaxID=62708 RepID=A0A420IMU8_9PEZI|nr:hypothetical protein GcC1_076038 [Golovinomyces cichoracearum]
MIVTECVVGILGALGGTYPTETLTLFERPKGQNYQVMASVDSATSGIPTPQGTENNLSSFKKVTPYIENNAKIIGRQNLFEICPSEVTLGDCTRVYNEESKEYQRCANYARFNEPVILFPPQRTKKRSMKMLFDEVAVRNKSPESMACFESLKSEKPELSKLYDTRTHEIVRDLIYEGKVRLTGKYKCNNLRMKTPVSINADIPLSINLDILHFGFQKYAGIHVFTTDGTQILHIYAKNSRIFWLEIVWKVKRANPRIVHDILRGADKLQKTFWLTRFLGQYEVCPFRESLKRDGKGLIFWR